MTAYIYRRGAGRERDYYGIKKWLGPIARKNRKRILADTVKK